ncbi:Tetraspanin [Operophtera brumata]|uniref:Tetraspanin n=1 Tax=Operophtera brumata TaxID=104452 RepID=A0A0L7L5Y5_OPEBR|nr:Tetraspanin [Operophtera brumata]
MSFLCLQLLGLAIIGIGVAFLLNWTVVKDELKSQLTVAPWVFIVIGAIMFVIAFFGCCGAIRESHCMVVTEGIVTSVHGLFNKRKSDNVDKATESIINNLQQQFSCCGSDGPTDYGAVLTLHDSCCARDPSIIGSVLGGKCTIENANPGCASTLAKLYEKWNKPIAGVAIGVACVEVRMRTQRAPTIGRL